MQCAMCRHAPLLTHSSEPMCYAMPKHRWSTKSRHETGYGSNWDRIRKVALNRDNHLCQSCLRRGRVTSANQVDHIKPKSRGGTDDLDNLRALCKPCHDEKTKTESRPSQRLQRDDGWRA